MQLLVHPLCTKSRGDESRIVSGRNRPVGLDQRMVGLGQITR
jgi:hypothetical protein